MDSEITDTTESSVTGRIFYDRLPLIALPGAVIALRDAFSAWVFMWLLAFSIFLACKWLTWRRVARKTRVGTLRSIAYLLAWPGMDAEAFFNKPARHRNTVRDWVDASARMAAGAVLFWLAASGKATANSLLLTGWIGMAASGSTTGSLACAWLVLA